MVMVVVGAPHRAELLLALRRDGAERKRRGGRGGHVNAVTNGRRAGGLAYTNNVIRAAAVRRVVGCDATRSSCRGSLRSVVSAGVVAAPSPRDTIGRSRSLLLLLLIASSAAHEPSEGGDAASIAILFRVP